MKVLYLVIVLFLSDITLTSGDDFCAFLVGGSTAVAAVGLFLYAAFTADIVLPFDPKRLHAELYTNLYGQHIVSNVVLKAVSSFMTNSNPDKPLVLSFHGTAGVGKTHLSKIIARSIFNRGDKSEHFITLIPQYHFPHKELVDSYCVQLKLLIHHQVLNFPRTMFVFDEMDKMNPRLIKTIKPFLDYMAHVDGVSYRQAIFIFLSNAGGDVINKIALDFWKAGKNREELQMNSKEMETQILKNVFNGEIVRHLVDHFIPFLPLERKHVKQCVLTEMVNMNITIDYDLADTVASEMQYFPSYEKIFSVNGCKTVRQKLRLYVN